MMTVREQKTGPLTKDIMYKDWLITSSPHGMLKISTSFKVLWLALLISMIIKQLARLNFIAAPLENIKVLCHNYITTIIIVAAVANLLVHIAMYLYVVSLGKIL